MLFLVVIILILTVGYLSLKFKNQTHAKDINLLPELEITYLGEDFDNDVKRCIEQRDFTGAQNIYISKCAEYDQNDPKKSYIYRRNQVHCTLMRYYNEQILELDLDLSKYEVQVLPNYRDKKNCKVGDGYRVDFKEFYKSPMLPCCVECKCSAPHFCSMIISPTYTDTDILDMV